ITNDVIRMIVNDYVRTNTSTIFNETVLYEVVDNYFQKNYNRHIDRTVFETSIRTYLETHHTTIISVDIVENIVTNYLKSYYLEIFDIDVLSVLVRNYFEENMTVVMETIRDGVDPVAGVNVVKDSCTITLHDGTTFTLPVYDAYTNLRDRLQSVVVMAQDNGHVKESANSSGSKYLDLDYLVSPAYLAEIIKTRFSKKQLSLELMTTDGNGSVSAIGVTSIKATSDGRITVRSSDYATGSVKAVALRVIDNASGGTDITSEFIAVNNLNTDPKPVIYPEGFSGEIKYEDIKYTVFVSHEVGSVVCSYSLDKFNKFVLNADGVKLSYDDFKKKYDIDNVVIEYWHNGADSPIFDPPYFHNTSWPCVRAGVDFYVDAVETSLFTIRVFDTIEENASGYVLFKIIPFDDHDYPPIVIKGEYKVIHPNHGWAAHGSNKIDENTVEVRGMMYGWHKRYRMYSALKDHFEDELEGWTAPGNHSSISFSLPLVNNKQQTGAVINDGTDMYAASIELTDYLTSDKLYTVRQSMDLDNGNVCTHDYFVKFVMPFMVASAPDIELPTVKNPSYYELFTDDGTDGIIIRENKEANPAVVYNSKTSSDEITDAQYEYGGLTFTVDSIELLTADGKEHLVDARLTVSEDGKIKWDNHCAALQKEFKARYRVTYTVDSGVEPFTYKLCKLVAEGNITCLATVKEKPSSGVQNGYGWVDLGLPSGLKWATCNVGAKTPEEYGDYFAWGETVPYYTEGHFQDDPCRSWKANKSGYKFASYKWCNGSYKTLTKYNTMSSYGPVVDNIITLEVVDDAARANWGGSWRMPTDAEWTELRTECTWTWTTRNGVNGTLVTGPNGNSIFLPAAGFRYDTNLYYAASYGDYWSSSLLTDYPGRAWFVDFSSDEVDRGYCSRCYGQSVRAVSE
ncbi:MAG: hypothetical protein IKH11_10620, partial [Bacteroidales bacterium]|nr:hypothetical protein [Bacteroidales bacterium]